MEPGVQAVPLVGSTAITMQASSDPGGDWEPGVDFVAWTKRVVPEVNASGQLLFVGYGVQAPEYRWDDFGGRRPRRQDPGRAGERPAGRAPLRRRRDDLLRPLDLQVREGRRDGGARCADRPRDRPRGIPLGSGERVLDGRAVRPADARRQSGPPGGRGMDLPGTGGVALRRPPGWTSRWRAGRPPTRTSPRSRPRSP